MLGVKANHGGIKNESVEDLESTAADTELSVTPSRRLRQQSRLVAGTEDGEVDSQDQLTHAAGVADLTLQHDVTVCLEFWFALFCIYLVTVI